MSSGSGALFGNSSGRSQSKHLVEFRAGKMTMKGKMVHPDKRKGLVYIYQSDDHLMHFCWKDRQKGTIEDDLIIFPDDIEYKHVPQCTSGRVFVLKFKSNNRKMFFWMQEPKTDKDEDYCNKLNEFLNHPPAPSSSRGSASGLGGLPAELAASLGGEADIQSLLGSMNQQQLMQLLSGMGGMGSMSSLLSGRSSSSLSDSNASSRVQSSAGGRTAANTMDTDAPFTASRPVTASGTTTVTSQAAGPASTTGHRDTTTVAVQETTATPRIQLSDLQNILSGLGALEPEASKESADLALSLTPEVMIPILANQDVQQRLIPFLPEGEVIPKSAEELRKTVHSPQFQQALQSFSAALASCQLGPLMAQFGLSDEAVQAANSGDVAAFAKALQTSLKKDEDKKPSDEK